MNSLTNKVTHDIDEHQAAVRSNVISLVRSLLHGVTLDAQLGHDLDVLVSVVVDTTHRTGPTGNEYPAFSRTTEFAQAFKRVTDELNNRNITTFDLLQV